MSDNPKYSRLVPVPVVHFPEVVFDMTQVQPQPPTLRLTARFRPGAAPAAVAADLHGLWKALDEFERGDGGAGLTPADADPTGDAVRLVYRSFREAGAADRLAKLAAAVNANQLPAGGSVLACTADVLTA